MRRLHKEWKRDVSVVMTALLVCGSVGVPAEAKETGGFIRENGLAAVQKLEPEVKTAEVTLSDQDKKQLEKEETVYVIANADGSPQKLIVSDWLKNAMGSEAIEDSTELTNIVNVKGDESFKQKEGSLGVWDAAGNDIYYQGNIQKELPVDMKVTYHLNGKAVSPDELAGQSGKVTIRFDYTNRQKEAVMVGEKEEELYVPFVLLTSMVLDNENFHNIEISNGKIINDGERTIVMGYAMPGLKDNLDIGSEDFDIEELDIPEYVELTADVTDFELATTLTVATNEIFGDMDIDTQEKMDELSEDMDDLEEAMNELMDGTAELYDGVLELYDGTEELTDGIGELDDGAGELNDGASSLKSGAGELVDGVAQLAAGLSTLTAQNATLVGGATQVFNSLLKQATDGLKKQVPQLQPVLEKVISDLAQVDPASAQKLKQQADGLTSTIMGEGLTIQNYATVLNGLLGLMEKMPSSTALLIDEEEIISKEAALEEMPEEENEEEQQSEKQQNTESKDNTLAPEEQEHPKEEQEIPAEKDPEQQPEQNEAEIVEEKQNSEPVEKDAKVDVQNAEPVVQNKEAAIVGASLNKADSGMSAIAAELKELKEQLDDYNKFYQGLQAYTAGVAQANQGAQALLDGAKKLRSGASELKDGTSELKDGTKELRDGGQELKDGVVELKDGSLELKDGTVEFNDEGIQKLLDMFNGDLQELSDRMDAVKSAANSYQSFSGISDGVQGNVRFIYKTAAIEK